MTWRPSKQTPEILAIIQSALECGCTRRASANIAGIAERTFYDWLDNEAADGPFRSMIEAAESEFERRVLTGAISHPATALKLLERRQRKDWYPPTEKVQIELTPNLEVVWDDGAAGDTPGTPAAEEAPAPAGDTEQPG